MRIPRNKFWGWVVVSLLVGLAIGLVIMLMSTASLNGKIATLQNRLDAAAAEASGSVSLQQQVTSAEASISALAQQNAELTSQLSAANKKPTTKKTTSSSSSTATISVVSRQVSPSTVATAATITMTVKVKGHPASVTVRIYNASKSFDKTYSLHRVSTSGNSETWRATTKAPTKKGTYHYYATAIKGSKRVTLPGASPKILTVH